MCPTGPATTVLRLRGKSGNSAGYQCTAGGDSGVGYMPPTPVPVGGTTYATGQAQAIAYCWSMNLGNCAPKGSLNNLWWPDLRTNQTSTILAIMVRF